MNVLFLGPDGVGKSSLVKGVQNVLQFKITTLYMGMGAEGWVLFDLHRYAAIERHCWLRKLTFTVLYWYILLPIEFTIRRLCARYRGCGNITLIDRFPGIPFVKGGIVGCLYKWVLPKPDLIVLLTGDPMTISRRKPDETTPDRTRRELDKWRTVANRLGEKWVLILDTTKKDIDSCVHEVVLEIHKSPKFMEDQQKDV